MDKKEVLYFEEDDASNISKNGKYVFLTKRINGKITHNKLQNQDQEEEQKINNNNKEEDYNLYEDIIIGVNNASFLERQKQEEKKAKIEKKKQEKLAKKRRKQNKKKQKSNSAKKQKEQDSELIYNTKISSNNLINDRSNSNIGSRKVTKSKSSRNKKKKKKNKMLKIFLLLFIIAGVIIFAMLSPIFNITTITVLGNERVRTDTVISLSELTIGSNIFRNSKNQISQKIKENQYVEEINIKRQLPGTIEINIKEREVAYQVKVIDSYVYIDYQGYILEIANQKENVPRIEGFSTSDEEFLNKKRVNSEDISILKDILKIMESAKNIEIANKITEINVENQKNYILTLKSEKKEVYIGDASNLNNKMLYVQIILEDEKKSEGRVFVNGDLTSGFKPYFDKNKK